MMTSVPKAKRPDHSGTLLPIVDREHQHPKLLPFRRVLRYGLSWGASKILGFSNIPKVRRLCMCRSALVLTGVSKLFCVSCMYCVYFTRIQKE